MHNQQNTHSKTLFVLSCIALTVTAMTFAIRAGILGQLGVEYGLTDTQLGWVNSMAFLGFPLSMLLGGLLYNSLGAKKLLVAAFLCHLLGLGLTITATGFWTLLISTFFIGFANGAVEAGCNPLIAELYKDQKTKMLNRFHVWFPGGIVIGAVVSKLMTDAGMSWQSQIAIMILPTLIYGYLTFKEAFPVTESKGQSTSANVKAMVSPLFIFMCVCMTLTATTELGTQQWIERILGASGASPMVIMAMITGLMAVGRFYAGPVVHRLNPTGVLLASSVIATAGIFLMSMVTGPMVYVAAILFAIGVMYFWPTMIGFVAESMPQTGALGLSVVGGAGMFGLSLWNPIIGSWIDDARSVATASQVPADQVELVTGQSVLADLAMFPLVLIVCFTGLYIYMKKSQANELNDSEATAS